MRTLAKTPRFGNRYLRVLFMQAAWVVLIKSNILLVREALRSRVHSFVCNHRRANTLIQIKNGRNLF